MNQWKMLTKISQVKKNDAIRVALNSNSGKHWIYIVENVLQNEIHLSGGEHYPAVKIIYQEELGEGQYEFVTLNNPHV